MNKLKKSTLQRIMETAFRSASGPINSSAHYLRFRERRSGGPSLPVGRKIAMPLWPLPDALMLPAEGLKAEREGG